MPKILKDRVGEIVRNKHGTLMEIIEYNHAKDMTIEWKDKYKVKQKVTYQHFKDGGVKNPYDKTIHGVGFLGAGKYTNKKGEILHIEAYKRWKAIFDRCCKGYHERNYVYDDCTISDEWCNFQNFAKWYEENYYKIDNELMCLDKDILFKGNKVYSKETCVFVPQSINKTFTKTNKNRGDFPIGVTKDKNGIRADCNIGNKESKFLGYFKTPKEAFESYKSCKENYIKYLAEEYKEQIPNNLYEAMYLYKVEISD